MVLLLFGRYILFQYTTERRADANPYPQNPERRQHERAENL